MYLLLLVIDFPDQYKTIHYKSTNKNSIFNKWFHTFHNSLENLNQFYDKFPRKNYSEYFWVKTYPNLLQFYNTSYTLPTRNEADGVLPNVLCIYYIKLDQK